MKKLIFLIAAILGFSSSYAADIPTFPGGEEALKKYIAANTRYPAVALENGVEGIVIVGFIVTTDGSLKNIKVIKFVDPDLEKEAVRVVTSMPAWIPAEKNGTPFEAPSKVEVPFLED